MSAMVDLEPITPLPMGAAPPILGAVAPGRPAITPSLTDRRKLQLARDCLIDCEDALMYVLNHDPSLQSIYDRTVALLMEVSQRADATPGSAR